MTGTGVMLAVIRRITLSASALVCLTGVPQLLAQEPARPPRDVTTAATPVAGSASLRGRVVDAASSLPVRRAQVTLAGDQGLQRLVTTDDDGRYAITGLPAGQVSLTVSKGGYLTLQYGQRRPFEPGRPVSLASAQALDGIDIALPRSSAISGRIVDRFGEPAVGAEIAVQRYQYGPDGQRRLARAPGTAVSTNDLGEFRWFGLMPGEYIVSANLRQRPSLAPPEQTGTPGVGYLQTYTGGTVSATNAQPVVVGIGEEAVVQFALAHGRLSRIAGTVVDSTGRPAAGAEMMLTTRGADGRTTGMGVPSTTADGAFSIANVPPGEHFVQVRLAPRADGTGGIEHANVPVSTAGSNVDGIQIVTTSPATVAGVVRWEGRAPRTGPTAALQITARTVDDRPAMVGLVGLSEVGANGMVRPDNSFRLGGLMGVVRLTATGVPSPWMVKSIAAGGVNLLTTGADAASIAGQVEVVLTDRAAQLSGSVRGAQGGAAGDSLVVVLPADPLDAAIAQPYVKTVRSDEKGNYQVSGLPPGSYVAAALEALEQGYEWDPAFQALVRKSARPFVLTEGQSAAMTLDLLR